ncbi:MAG: hypothetical protein HY752_03310 [Nitrospirae bacterium]|nr:hypothetical protein [Nitrospirota bacterium]
MPGKTLKIFFSGIAGSGMSAIASFMSDKGNIIVGSDRAFDTDPSHPIKKVFQSKGITIVPQDGSGIDDTFDFVVFSTAVEPEMPEVLKARTLGIHIKTRPQELAEITSSFKTIAVSGTSGKSTTSGLLAFLMKRLGLNPNFIGGGRVKQFKSSSNPGNSLTGDSDYLVIEACESDGTIINYKPRHSIILNLDLDHHPIEKTAEMFKTLMKNTTGNIVVNADDKNLRETFVSNGFAKKYENTVNVIPVKVVPACSKRGTGIQKKELDSPIKSGNDKMRETFYEQIANKNIVTFSIHNLSHYKADAVTYKPFNTDFSVHGTKFNLSLPGKYNLYNALSCIVLLSESGIPLKDIADVLHEFQGIDRRFDVHLNDGERLVVDDYAHNPHKISAIMETVKQLREHICYIFQPHGFGPTRLMKNEYIEAFTEGLRASDHLILLPIFYAGGTACKDISSHDLAEGIRANGKSVEVVEGRDDILKRLREHYAYVIFGARDETLSDFAKEIARIIKKNKQHRG